MTAIPDHYAALGIDPTADPEVITAAYRALAKKFHPDTGASSGTASPGRFAEIQQAYEVLGTAESRSRYDLELLEATQRELDEHLARKQRRIGSAQAASAPGAVPPPDLGVIRPERRRPVTWKTGKGLRDLGPFLVVSVLLLAVSGGLASLFIGNAPLEEPPLPQTEQSDAAPSPAPSPPAATSAKPAPAPPAPETKQASLPVEKPLFGSSMMDAPAASPAPAAEDPVPPPSPAPSPATAVSDPAPLPRQKPRPAAAVKPPQREASATRFTVVIFEKYISGDVIQDDGGIVFASEDRCDEFGEATVLRRLAPYEGQRRRPRIWYKCQPAP